MVRNISSISMKPFMGQIAGLAICDKCDFFILRLPQQYNYVYYNEV